MKDQEQHQVDCRNQRGLKELQITTEDVRYKTQDTPR